MTMTAVVHPVRFTAPVPAFLDDLRVAFYTFRQRRAERAALARAARLGPRLLEDMGIATAVPRPLVGAWDELPSNGFLVRRRRGA